MRHRRGTWFRQKNAPLATSRGALSAKSTSSAAAASPISASSASTEDVKNARPIPSTKKWLNFLEMKKNEDEGVGEKLEKW